MTLHAIVPRGFDDPARPSGGNVYDRAVLEQLTAFGRAVTVHAVEGTWPNPDITARAVMSDLVDSVPDEATVLVDGLIASSVSELLVAAARRLRLVVLVHMPLGDQPIGHAMPDARRREGEVLAAACAIVTTSSWTAGRLRALHNLPVDRVHVATPGVARADLTASTSSGERLLCVATLAEHKGQDLLVNALAQLADRTWHCTLVGPVDREPEFVARLRRHIATSGLGNRIEIAGPRIGPSLARAYGSADLVIAPSRVEAYGMVLTEALAHGVPVVAADVGGVAEAVGHDPAGQRPGLLVRSDDSGDLAEALKRWLDDGAVRAGLRTAARQRRDTLKSWEETAADLLRAIDSCHASG